MTSAFQNSLFYKILFEKNVVEGAPYEILGGITGSRFGDDESFHEKPIVILDFETTGLDTKRSRIIEIGAIKYLNRKEVDRFSFLIQPGFSISPTITQICGITNEMLEGKPFIKEILPAFHDFLRGSICVAHNAEFDVGMLFYESLRIGVGCDFTVICSLKMARALVKIERRNLDALAKHYNLTFESRHRSIGDILVTAGVLWNMLDENKHLQKIKDFEPYREQMPKE